MSNVNTTVVELWKGQVRLIEGPHYISPPIMSFVKLYSSYYTITIL